METNGNMEFNFLAFSLQPSTLVSVIGKFGGADQLRNAVP
jgi:nitrate reductase NapE component